MSNKVKISLVGAGTYGTLTTVFQRGTPHLVTPELWETLKDVNNIATGERLFCLTADLPVPEATVEDLRASGLSDIDTASTQAEIDLSKIPDGSDRSDLDSDDPATQTTTNPENGPKDATAAPKAPHKLTLGKGKAVTV